MAGHYSMSTELPMTTSSRISFLNFGNGSFKNITESMPVAFPPIISDKAMFDIHLYFGIVFTGIFAMLGVTNNVINIIIFYKMGLNDSASVCLMNLSIADFLISLLALASKVLLTWDKFFHSQSPINPLAIAYMLGWLRDVAYLCSGCINTFLSAERCICVTFPFKVKVIFTRFRCIVCMMIIYIVHIALLVAVYANVWLEWVQVEIDKGGGGTVLTQRLAVVFSDSWPDVHFYLNIITGMVIPIPSQVLIMISVMWLIYGLKKSSKVRRHDLDSAKATAGKESQSGLSHKERRLVKMVLTLAIILAICNLPRFAAIYCQEIDPDISYGRRENNLYSLLWHLAIGANIVNSSINFFVYISINTTYRCTLEKMFCCK